MKAVRVTPVISTLVYAAGDAVGGLMEFELAVGYPGRGGRIVGAEIIDRSGVGAALTLQLFDRTFTASADNAAYAPSDSDIANAIGNVLIAAGDYAGGSGNKVATKSGLDIPFVLVGTSLFGQLFTQGTPTYGSAGDLTVVLYIEEG